MPKITQINRNKVIVLHEEGYSQAEIARRVKCSRSSVQRIIKKYNDTGDVVDRPKSGRPKKLTDADAQYLKMMALRDRKKVSKDLARNLEEATGSKVHPATVRRSLKKSGLRGCVAIKKPLLRRGNKGKRLKYAKEHQSWGDNEWKQVLWTDESKFQLFGSNRRQYVRRRVGESLLEPCLQATVKHGGGNIQVWGCISSEGVGDIIKIEGKLTGEKYRELLEHYAIPSGLRLIGRNFILQHDNDPKHTSRVVKNYLRQQEENGELRTMIWPPQSPDLNIIEHVWDYLDRKKTERSPRNLNELWDVLQEEWYNIPDEFIKKLHDSLNKRISDTIRFKGDHTKY